MMNTPIGLEDMNKLRAKSAEPKWDAHTMQERFDEAAPAPEEARWTADGAPAPEEARWTADGAPANLAAAAADAWDWLRVLQKSPLPFIDRLDRAQREECRARLDRAVERLAYFLDEPETAGEAFGTAEAIPAPEFG